MVHEYMCVEFVAEQHDMIAVTALHPAIIVFSHYSNIES